MIIGMTLIGIALGIIIGWIARDKARNAVEEHIEQIKEERIADLEEECEGLRWQLEELREKYNALTKPEYTDNETDESGAPYTIREDKQ